MTEAFPAILVRLEGDLKLLAELGKRGEFVVAPDGPALRVEGGRGRQLAGLVVAARLGEGVGGRATTFPPEPPRVLPVVVHRGLVELGLEGLEEVRDIRGGHGGEDEEGGTGVEGGSLADEAEPAVELRVVEHEPGGEDDDGKLDASLGCRLLPLDDLVDQFVIESLKVGRAGAGFELVWLP